MKEELASPGMALLARGSEALQLLGVLKSFSQRKPLGAIGGVVVLLTILTAVLAPLFAPFGPYEAHYTDAFAPPSSRYWFGTDNLGRDMLSRIIYGSRVSLLVGIVCVALGTTGGALLGVVSGYLGGRVDLLTQRLMDAILAFPLLILAMAIVAVLGPALQNVIAAISIVLIPGAARVTRSTALAIKETDYITATRALGASDRRIIFRHVVPNCVAPYLIVASAALGSVIVTEATLSFLGFGTPPPIPSWGGMLSGLGRDRLETAPWLAISPGVAIALVVFGFNILGDALRDVLDPRLRGTGR